MISKNEKIMILSIKIDALCVLRNKTAQADLLEIGRFTAKNGGTV